MKQNIQTYHILNTVMIWSIIVWVVKSLHLFVIPVPAYIFILLAVAAPLIKKSVEKDMKNTRDPLIHQQPARGFFYVGLGILMIAIMFRLMHWPFAYYWYLAVFGFMMIAWIFSIAYPNGIQSNDKEDILDN